jgi:hypothetical protein
MASICLLQSQKVAKSSNRNRDAFRNGAHNAKDGIHVLGEPLSAAVGPKFVSDHIFDAVGGNLARRCVELPSRFCSMSRENESESANVLMRASPARNLSIND